MSSVLIVDDEKHVRDYVYDVLSDRYSCDVATNADEAIRILETGSYEIVITDISMPGISGLELFGYIRETRPDIPVIVISGISDLDYVKGLVQMGVFHYMMKPFGPSELEAAVENAFTHLGKLKKEREIQFTDSWSTEGTEQNLLEIERRWVEAYRRRDNAVLLEIWAPDFVLTNSFGEIMPRNQAIASVSSEMTIDFYWTFDLHGNVFADTAVVTGRAIALGSYKDHDLAGQYRFTNTYAKRPNGWTAIASHITRVESL